ncbi:PhnA domain-containing protein [Aliarcobacter cryaerophilus]|uniref:PhnA domain-containing protein n=1 Tax=Aliarcobacter cryaerophilus TaxID=28198 RepID=UPI0021B1D681|nr:alkylphosphonate utilization protein [Aliarcobacter cryaerophilus]MCT7494507.1 PhnA domain-containing protein [Aliarcobacter cryaerophilus]
MGILEDLIKRAENSCELCKSLEDLDIFEVNPSDGTMEQSALLCPKCKSQFEQNCELDQNHWYCLSEAMWSETPAVKVLSYRMLKKLDNQELLDMIYLDDETLFWANKGLEEFNTSVVQKDCNGVVLNAGDTVTIIKDLEVKGAGFTAKRGTAVRNISLGSEEGQIEGRVNGVKIVILTQFVKKS